MARTPSTMLELGTLAPSFTLNEPATGNKVSLSDFVQQPLLIVFTCNHCPYVLHIQDEFLSFAHEYTTKGLAIVSINSNDVSNYSDDSPEKMAEAANTLKFPFPYLFDESQTTAKAYQAACTPDFFLFDATHRLVYRGQFDGSRPQNDTPVTGYDLRKAADALLTGASMPTDQTPSLGCNIKWKTNNAPDYFS